MNKKHFINILFGLTILLSTSFFIKTSQIAQWGTDLIKEKTLSLMAAKYKALTDRAKIMVEKLGLYSKQDPQIVYPSWTPSPLRGIRGFTIKIVEFSNTTDTDFFINKVDPTSAYKPLAGCIGRNKVSNVDLELSSKISYELSESGDDDQNTPPVNNIKFISATKSNNNCPASDLDYITLADNNQTISFCGNRSSLATARQYLLGIEITNNGLIFYNNNDGSILNQNASGIEFRNKN